MVDLGFWDKKWIDLDCVDLPKRVLSSRCLNYWTIYPDIAKLVNMTPKSGLWVDISWVVDHWKLDKDGLGGFPLRKHPTNVAFPCLSPFAWIQFVVPNRSRRIDLDLCLLVISHKTSHYLLVMFQILVGIFWSIQIFLIISHICRELFFFSKREWSSPHQTGWIFAC